MKNARQLRDEADKIYRRMKKILQKSLKKKLSRYHEKLWDKLDKQQEDLLVKAKILENMQEKGTK